MTASSQRVYAGVPAQDRADDRRSRLVAAGLEILGTQGAAALTVRGVIRESGLAPRYFYDHIGGLDELQVAVFNQVLAEVEAAALQAVASSLNRPRARIHAVLAAVTGVLLDDPRKGRVVLTESLSSPALGDLRAEAAARFARQLAAHSRGAWSGQRPDSHPVVVTAQFAIGGFGETLTGVLQGRVHVARDHLVGDLTELFLGTGAAIREILRRQ